MSLIRNILQPRALLVILTLLLTMKATSGGCECKSSSSSSSATSTPAPPPNPQINIANQYGPTATVAYEIWTGSNLEYRNGTVYGDNLTRAASLSTIGNGATQNSVTTISYDTAFLVVFGVLDGATYVYITNKVVNNYKSTATFTLLANGTVN